MWHWWLIDSLKASVLTGASSVWNPHPTITVAFQNRQLANCGVEWKQARFKTSSESSFSFPTQLLSSVCLCAEQRNTVWTPVESVRDRAPTCTVSRLQRCTQSSSSEFLKRDLEDRGEAAKKRRPWHGFRLKAKGRFGFSLGFSKSTKKEKVTFRTRQIPAPSLKSFIEKLCWQEESIDLVNIAISHNFSYKVLHQSSVQWTWVW